MSSIIATISAYRLACDNEAKKRGDPACKEKAKMNLKEPNTGTIAVIKPDTDDSNSMKGLTRAITEGRLGANRLKENIVGRLFDF